MTKGRVTTVRYWLYRGLVSIQADWLLRVPTRQPAHGTARAPDDGRQLEKCNRGNQRTALYRL